MKIEIGKKYKTRNGLLAKVKSNKGGGSVFYGVVIGDDGDLIDEEWRENGLTNDSIVNHPHELMHEVKFAEVVLGRITNAFINVFALSLAIASLPFLLLLLGCYLGVSALIYCLNRGFREN